MEFLKTCTTNAQAIGDFEAIAYLAFSLSPNTTPSSSKPSQLWSPDDDIRAAEAELRHGLHLVARDASRPWLWLFKPTTVDKIAQTTVELPPLDGYRLQRASSPPPLYMSCCPTNTLQANTREPSRPSIWSARPCAQALRMQLLPRTIPSQQLHPKEANSLATTQSPRRQTHSSKRRAIRPRNPTASPCMSSLHPRSLP